MLHEEHKQVFNIVFILMRWEVLYISNTI
jgi:hypothetical protein